MKNFQLNSSHYISYVLENCQMFCSTSLQYQDGRNIEDCTARFALLGFVF